MKLNELTIRDFRSHAAGTFVFGDGINLISGPNGVGKTNILEAVHVLALTKSFLASDDRTLLRNGSPFFELRGRFSGRLRERVDVRIAYAPGETKRVSVNGSDIERFSAHVGTVPIVLLCPQDQALTAGPPSERRRFLDSIISQSSSVYLNNLLRYRRALKQRNALLGQMRRSGQSSGGPQLESWTHELMETGAAIVSVRAAFCERFAEQLAGAHERIGQTVERPGMVYETFAGMGQSDLSIENARTAFANALEKTHRAERARGLTRVGPHRDDLTFTLDGLEVRRYASQGQHRTFGIALKMAQYDYLEEEMGEPPIMLLDDVFDNLDAGRIERFLEILGGNPAGQSIVTAARKEILSPFVNLDADRIGLIELSANTGRQNGQDPADASRNPQPADAVQQTDAATV